MSRSPLAPSNQNKQNWPWTPSSRFVSLSSPPSALLFHVSFPTMDTFTCTYLLFTFSYTRSIDLHARAYCYSPVLMIWLHEESCSVRGMFNPFAPTLVFIFGWFLLVRFMWKLLEIGNSTLNFLAQYYSDTVLR